jgi:hypothetical protein
MNDYFQRIKQLEAQVLHLEEERSRFQDQIRNPPNPGLWQPGKNHAYYYNKVSAINNLINERAREFATTKASPWQDLGDYERWHFVIGTVGSVATLVDGDIAKSLKGPKAAKLLLDALAANHIFLHVFAVPFFSTPNHRCQSPGDLNWVYVKLCEGMLTS